MSEMSQIKNCLIFLLIRIGIHQIFWICNPEYLNSKTYRWILMKISDHVRNGSNYQVTTLFCLSRLVSGKYYGLVISKIFWICNPKCPKSKSYCGILIKKFRSCQKWTKLASSFLLLIQISIRKILWIANF